jgi:pimeloyl-ACP methyl ester carboxylesterase
MVVGRTFTTSARWFGLPDRSLLGWWTRPKIGTQRSGAVILPAIGYEYNSAHRTLRTLAERLADRGHGVLRIDYDGVGDSAGDRWDDARVDAWRRSVANAVDELRALGAEKVTLIGVRLGATLALAEAAGVRADAVVAWAPVLQGRRFMRELRMLGLVVPSATPQPRETIVYAGTVFSPDTGVALGKIDLEKLPEKPASRVLVIARPDHPCEKLLARLHELGTDATQQVLEGSETALDVPAEVSSVPTAIVDAILSWVGASETGVAAESAPSSRATAEIAWNGGRVKEEVTTLGKPGLVGVLGGPLDRQQQKETTVVFLNSGSEPHTGPGRCWVEYARELNLRGYRTVRLDFSGWGESPDHGHSPGRPYDAHCIDEAVAVTAALRDAGHRRVVLAGLCAGAWIGLRAALHTPLAAVIAINPQLYWQPGDPLDVSIAETIKRRALIREREAALKKWHLWSALDLAGYRTYAGRWLTKLARTRLPTLLLFAEGDEGIVFLETRLSRRVRRVSRGGSIQIVQVSDVDHQMYREWRRTDVVGKMLEFLDGLPRVE